MMLQIGDKIRVSNWYTTYDVEIESVTKTKAISKPYNSSGARLSFRRDKTTIIRPFKRIRYNQTTYTLITGSQR